MVRPLTLETDDTFCETKTLVTNSTGDTLSLFSVIILKQLRFSLPTSVSGESFLFFVLVTFLLFCAVREEQLHGSHDDERKMKTV